MKTEGNTIKKPAYMEWGSAKLKEEMVNKIPYS
jgi:hypothetical protein